MLPCLSYLAEKVQSIYRIPLIFNYIVYQIHKTILKINESANSTNQLVQPQMNLAI